MTSTIILAAGLSRRMGEDNKLLLPFQGKALLLHMVDAILGSHVDEIIVVTGFESDKIMEAVGKRNVRFIYNPNYEKGLTSSIQAGVLACDEKAQGYLICLSDMPFVKTKHINSILNELKKESKNAIIIPEINNKRSHPIFLSNVYKAEILEHENPDGCKKIIKKNKEHIRFIHFDEDFSKDIDTPETYKKLHERNQ